jgi:hypothetical protein
MIRRVNSGGGHAYFDRDEEGTERQLDGVTTLLGNAIPKNLTKWAADQSASYAVEHWDELAPLPLLKRADEIRYAWRRTLGKASAKGTEIHSLAERLSRGEPVEIPDEYEAHVEQCVHFLDKFAPEPVVAEAVVVNRAVGYAGTLDLVADMLDHRYLIDWKTGNNVYAEAALQLAAYAHAEAYLSPEAYRLPEAQAERPMAELRIERGAVVHLRADGYDVYPMRIDDVAFRVFRHAAYMARWLKWDRDSGSPLDSFKAAPLRLEGTA